MKHLKIYFAVLFFSFLGAAQNQLFAQEPDGSWTRTYKVGDILENGDYRAIFEHNKAWKRLQVRVYKASDNSAVSNSFVWELESSHTCYSLSFVVPPSWNSEDILYQVFNTEPKNTFKYALSIKGGRRTAGEVLNTTEEVTLSAYIKLEDDGRVVIYSGTGGVPIVTLGKKD